MAVPVVCDHAGESIAGGDGDGKTQNRTYHRGPQSGDHLTRVLDGEVPKREKLVAPGTNNLLLQCRGQAVRAFPQYAVYAVQRVGRLDGPSSLVSALAAILSYAAASASSEGSSYGIVLKST